MAFPASKVVNLHSISPWNEPLVTRRSNVRCWSSALSYSVNSTSKFFLKKWAEIFSSNRSALISSAFNLCRNLFLATSLKFLVILFTAKAFIAKYSIPGVLFFQMDLPLLCKSVYSFKGSINGFRLLRKYLYVMPGFRTKFRSEFSQCFLSVNEMNLSISLPILTSSKSIVSSFISTSDFCFFRLIL